MLAHPCTARLTAPLLLSLALLASTLPGAARADDSTGLSGWQPGPDAPLELSRYMGRWYVVARVANPVERGHVGSFHDYTLDGDQRVRIQYHFRESFDQPLQVMPLRARVDDHSGKNHNVQLAFALHHLLLRVQDTYFYRFLHLYRQFFLAVR